MAKKPTVKKSKQGVAKAKRSAPPSARAGKDAFIGIDQEIWPIERNVFFRPDRLKYVRKIIKTEGCVFCRAAEEELSFETLCIVKTRHSMVVVNKFPYNSGHVLVLPRRHCGDMLELSADEYADLTALIRECMRALNDVYAPGGMNLGLNHGAVAGAGIPDHLHFHLIPRWGGDLNFFPLIAETKVVIESIEGTYERLLAFFSKRG